MINILIENTPFLYMSILIHSMFKLCSLDIIKIKQTKISNIDKEKIWATSEKYVF